MKLQELFKYSWFSDLAYVRWSEADGIAPDPANTEAEDLINAANDKDNPRIPGETFPGDQNIDTLGERIFQPTTVGNKGLKGLGWQLLSFTPNDDSGFAASNIFSRVAAR